ncbi:DUF262 domain-containing protein [Pseudomonas sp.]|uniref:DUF262 domain-containing protein n=1 Tax=Pseudomonas sp. TaxID=306 RepID=UPI003F400337
MHKKTLTTLFSESLYRIPDYQRGYAWIEKQWNDFVQDIDALVDEQVHGHYTGTVVVYAGRNSEVVNYGTRRLKVVDVVDGQQRLTTSCLYLSLILRELIERGQLDYEREIPDFLHADGRCKLELNNDSQHIFYDLLKTGRPNTEVLTPHGKRLVQAHGYFKRHLKTQLEKRSDEAVAYLKELYIALTGKLHFTFYTIEEECEIGMTFELMNSRGKDLSVLELLKNYLMHWASRNGHVGGTSEALTRILNRSWKTTYTNMGNCSGNEDQCLRIAWILYCTHTPKNWIGYKGFKDSQYIPLRDFSQRSLDSTRQFICTFAEGLAEVSRHYACITSPTAGNITGGELQWITKIHHTGNIANFLPLMVAARKRREDGRLKEEDYIKLLKALEHYAYRVFLYDGRRSNAGKSRFNHWGYEVFHGTQEITDVIASIYGLARHYSSDSSFFTGNATPENWYGYRTLLKYTLYEYELYLLEVEGKGNSAKLAWEDLRDSTIEHILPQTPAEDSYWTALWSRDEMELYLHDIGNLVLTHNNSNYLNFDFLRKKGSAGKGNSYSNSDIRQERKLALNEDWRAEECDQRRRVLVDWINTRWGAAAFQDIPTVEAIEDADEDGTEMVSESN